MKKFTVNTTFMTFCGFRSPADVIVSLIFKTTEYCQKNSSNLIQIEEISIDFQSTSMISSIEQLQASVIDQKR